LLLLASVGVTNAQPYGASGDVSSSYTWNDLRIGGGGFVTGLVIHPTTPNLVYARTDTNGLYRWDEGSQTWTRLLRASRVPGLNDAMRNEYGKAETGVESVAVSKNNNQVVYAAVGDSLNEWTGRILKSTNRGDGWSECGNGRRWKMAGNAGYREGGERLAVDPNNGGVVYFGSRLEGLWVSNDGCGNWNALPLHQIPLGSNSGDAAGVRVVTFDPTSPVIGGKTSRIYAGVAGQGIYVSNDAGTNWSKIYNSTGVPLDAEVASDGTLYVGIGGGDNKVVKYTPSTNTATVVTPPGAGSPRLAVDPFNPQRLFVGDGGTGDGRFWRSGNGGANWETLNVAMAALDIPWILNTNEDAYMSMGDIKLDPMARDRLWFAQGAGMWRSNDLFDGEVTWTFVNKGLENMVSYDIIAPPGGKVVTALGDRLGFYHDSVTSYPQRPNLTNQFSGGQGLDYSGKNPSFVVAVASDYRGCCGDRSYSGYSWDGGKNWIQFKPNIRDTYPLLYGGNIAVSATDTSNIVWQPTNWNLPHVSTDRGQTWTKLTFFEGKNDLHQLIWWGSKRALDSDKVDGSFYIYSISGGGTFYRSTNRGQTWEQAPGVAPSGADAQVFGQVRAVPGFAGHVWVSTAKGGLSFTENKGNSWTKASGVQETRAFGFGKAVAGSYPTVYMYGKVNDTWGVWRSTNKGAAWDLVARYPGDVYYPIAVVNGDMNVAGRVYVGVGGGSFIYGDSSAGGPGVTITTLQPTDDRDSDNGSGSAQSINTSKWTTAFVKFNVAAIGGTITQANMRIYAPNLPQGAVTLTAYRIDNDAWSENGSTLPGYGDALASVNVTTAGYAELNLTDYVKSQKAGDSVVSFALKTNKDGWTGFGSKENTYKPELVVMAS
jgi:hypothetical protein